MASVKLTNATLRSAVEKAERTGNRQDLWDTTASKLVARCYKSGTVNFFWRQNHKGGKYSLLKLGTLTNVYGIAAARQDANRYNADAGQGVDVKRVKQAEVVRQRVEVENHRVQTLMDRYLATALVGRSPEYVRDTKFQAKRYIVDFFGPDTIINDITRGQGAAMWEALAGQPSTQRKIFQLGNRFFDYCISRGWLDTSPMTGQRCEVKLTRRDVVLSDSDLMTIWGASAALAPVQRGLIRMLIITGQRLSQTAQMEWTELDLEARTWSIPGAKMKNNQPHLVHLSDIAMDTLTELAAVRKPTSPYVFSSRKNTAFTAFNYMMRELRKHVMETNGGAPLMSEWRVHDLRRSVATNLQAMGVPLMTTERVLAHISGSQGGLIGTYQRAEMLPERREALYQWGQRLTRLVGHTATDEHANVVQLHRAD